MYYMTTNLGVNKITPRPQISCFIKESNIWERKLVFRNLFFSDTNNISASFGTGLSS